MSIFKKGDTVRQVVPVIEGTVGGFQIDQETGARLVLVISTDEQGQPQSRYFDETQLTLAASAETKAIQPAAEETAIRS